MDWDRRTYLGLLAGAFGAGTAGCLGLGSPASDDGGQSTRTPTGRDDRASPTGTGGGASPTPTPTRAPTPETPVRDRTETVPNGGTGTAPGDGDATTATGGTVRLTAVEPGPGTPLRVYPTALRETLRRAATGDGPVRAVGSAFVYMPDPPLPSFDAVELVDPAGGAGGVYAVDCQAGTRYEMLVDVEEASTPDDTTVTPVETLPPDRREFVRALVGGEQRRVYPETPLGEWVRTRFFGGYFRADGSTYRGYEVQQTDAAFFSTEAWYVLSLSPAEDAADPVTLDLSPVDPAVRGFLDPVLEDRTKGRTVTIGVDEFPAAVRSFVSTTDRILTHDEALGVAIEG